MDSLYESQNHTILSKALMGIQNWECDYLLHPLIYYCGSQSHIESHTMKRFLLNHNKISLYLRWTDRFPFSLPLLLSSILPPPQILCVYSPPFIILQFCFFLFLWQCDFVCIALLFLPLPKTVSRKLAYYRCFYRSFTLGILLRIYSHWSLIWKQHANYKNVGDIYSNFL